MFTLHHGLWIYFFTRRHAQVWQFVAGSMLPDYVYFLMIGLMLIRGQLNFTEITSLSPQVMMFFLPMYPWVVKTDLIGHSVVVWGAAFILTLLPVVNRLQAFVVGWGTHLLFDAFTHGAYANLFLYPLSLYAVHSPVSFWEPAYFAREFNIVNSALMALMAGYILYKWLSKKYRK